MRISLWMEQKLKPTQIDIHLSGEKLFTKILACIDAGNIEYMTNFAVTKGALLCDLKRVLDFLEEKRQKGQIEFVHGIGNYIKMKCSFTIPDFFLSRKR